MGSGYPPPMRTLLQSLGAVFPFAGATPSPRGEGHGPASAVAERPASTHDAPHATRARQAPETQAPQPRRSTDPYYLQVVPYVPADVSPRPQRFVHPRIVNPFRHFPRRAHHLFALMERSASPDAAASSDPQY